MVWSCETKGGGICGKKSDGDRPTERRIKPEVDGLCKRGRCVPTGQVEESCQKTLTPHRRGKRCIEKEEKQAIQL